MIGSYTKKVDFEFIDALPNQGANSFVFLAKDKQFENILIYKRIDKAKIDPSEYFKEAKFIYENRHQYVVSVNYGCYDDDYVYIGMPYYPNGSIKDKIINNNYLTCKEVIRYSLQFLTGLNYIHSRGYIHFDIKPDNIMISDSDEALLSDFGLTKHSVYGLNMPDKIYGLHHTPEFIVRNPSDIRSDIYQAGLTIFRMLNGHDVLQKQAITMGLTKNHILMAKFPDRNSYLPHIPLSLRKIVNKCIMVNPDDRYQNVLEVINDLSSIPNSPNLNWRYSNDGITEMWGKESDNNKYSITVTGGKSFDIYTTKESPARKQRIRQYCFNNISLSDKNKILKEAIYKL